MKSRNQHNTVPVTYDVIGMITATRARPFRFNAALQELIDNSIDAGATKITMLETESGDFIIEDNGCGFSNIASAVMVGASTKTGKIGRFGVGLKDACIKHSSQTVIESKGSRLTVPWNEIIAGDNEGDALCEEIDDDGYTRIILRDWREFFRRQKMAVPIDSIRQVYLRAIQSGSVTMTYNGLRIDPMPEPKFIESLDVEFSWRGRRVRLRGGVFSTDDPMREVWAGYNLFYMDRLVVARHSTSGVGEESCSNFAFFVDLADAENTWSLQANKDGIEDMHDLLEYIYDQHTADMLRRGAEQAAEIELREIEDIVNSSLSCNGNITRKGKTGKNGGKKPNGKGSPKRRTNTATTDGLYIDTDSSSQCSNKRFVFSFQRLAGETAGQITFKSKRMIEIIANLNNSFIAKHKKNANAMTCFAKLCYAMRRVTQNYDTVYDEVIKEIMAVAGSEFAYGMEHDVQQSEER